VSKREDEQFQAWVEEVSKKTKPEEADAFKLWAESDAAREVFRGTIGQAELYRRMNELAETRKELEAARGELEAWYEEEAPKNEHLLKERDELKAQLEALGSGGPPPAAGTGSAISAQDLAELNAKANKAEVLDRLLPAVLGDMSAVLKDSIKNNFDIDPREVIKLSLQQGIEPYRAYEVLTADERQKRYEASQEAEKKKWFEEGRRAAMTNSPDHLQPSGPSVVDYLKDLGKDPAKKSPEKDDRVASALKEFAEGNF